MKNTRQKTHVYVAAPLSISPGQFKGFLKQCSKNVPLERLLLCRRLKREWDKSAKNPASIKGKDRHYEVSLPSTRGLRNRVPHSQGLYGIYASSHTGRTCECFYVGISTTNIYDRLAKHLREDIKKNYSDGFADLRESSQIVICYATTDFGNSDTQKVRRKLHLLEECLTVLLRPKFLTLAAE